MWPIITSFKYIIQSNSSNAILNFLNILFSPGSLKWIWSHIQIWLLFFSWLCLRIAKQQAQITYFTLLPPRLASCKQHLVQTCWLFSEFRYNRFFIKSIVPSRCRCIEVQLLRFIVQEQVFIIIRFLCCFACWVCIKTYKTISCNQLTVK